MNILISLIQIFLLLAIVFQDLKYRAVYWLFFPLLFASNAWFIWILAGKEVLLQNFMVNLSIVLIHILILTFYFSVKHKRFTNIINRYLGLGDVFMLLTFTVIFSPIAYMGFMILSLFSSLFYALIFFKPKAQNKTIPLAGIMSTVFIPIACLALILPEWPALEPIFQLTYFIL